MVFRLMQRMSPSWNPGFTVFGSHATELVCHSGPVYRSRVAVYCDALSHQYWRGSFSRIDFQVIFGVSAPSRGYVSASCVITVDQRQVIAGVMLCALVNPVQDDDITVSDARLCSISR